MPPEQVLAFAPGRINLIGEHTDYNEGLALPCAIAEGVRVRASANGGERIRAQALDLGEHDEFELAQAGAQRAEGWRAFVRGAVAELGAAGFALRGATLEITGEVPRGAGLSSSAALEVALCLALLALAGTPVQELDRVALARLCARIENNWVGAHTGLLDQLACLFGEPEAALLIDFQTLAIEPVPLRLHGGWRLVTLDSGERHTHAASAYNTRRAECAAAAQRLGVCSLRHASVAALERLPEPLRRRARHVVSENARVQQAVAALQGREFPPLGALLDASHASLRDDFEVSTPALDAAVARLREAGAAGARMIGGGFGGHVLGLLTPAARTPPGAREVHAGAGAHLQASKCSGPLSSSPASAPRVPPRQP